MESGENYKKITLAYCLERFPQKSMALNITDDFQSVLCTLESLFTFFFVLFHVNSSHLIRGS